MVDLARAVALAAFVLVANAQPAHTQPVAGAAEHETPLPWFEPEAGAPGGALPAPEDATPRLDAVEARDPRVIEADGYLGDRDTYGQATELYRDYLRERPDDDAVRLRLARVLSWAGALDESLVEYDALAGAETADPDAAIERAEVLSWAGRYRAAEAAFRAILASQPDHARAARGLARVFLWSGRSYEADRAYARALEMEEDDATRSEWEGLHALFRPQVGARATRRSDNDDYFFQSMTTHGATYLSLRTRLLGEASYWRTRGEVERSGGRRERLRHEGAAYSVGVEHHLNPAWLATARVGHEAWAGAPDQVLADVELRFTPLDTTSVGFGYEHSGAGRPLESFDAVEAGIHRNELRLSLWQDLGGPLELWTQAGGGWISDGNARAHGALSLTYKPLEDHELGFHLAHSVLHYAEDSNLYYDPDLDIDNQLSVDYLRPLFGGLRLRVESAVGYGLSREAGRTSDGVVFRTGSYLWWDWRRWSVELGGTVSQSRRRDVYRSLFFSAALTRSF